MTGWSWSRVPYGATRFAGNARHAMILGTLAVTATYGVIFSIIAYVVIFCSSLTVIFIRANCSVRAGGMVDSMLYGTALSPLCGDSIAGQAAVLALPILELLLVFLLIRGPPPPDGEPLEPIVESAVRTVFAPIVPKVAGLRLYSWQHSSRITPDGVLFGPSVVAEFRAWIFGAPIDPKRLRAHLAIFTTLHELGHLAMHDVLYSRGSDRAVPVASIFVGLFLLVAMPAGGLVQGFSPSVILTGLECVAAVLATRCVLGRILTNLEFLMDNFAAAQGVAMTGRRLALPPFLKEDRRSWFRRSHPTLTARRQYLRSMRCGDFLWAYLATLILLLLLQWASTPTGDTISVVEFLLVVTDLTIAAALFILGVMGGAAAARGQAPGGWWCYGVASVFLTSLLLTGGFFNIPPYAADAAQRLSRHGRDGLWLLILVAPLAGIGIRQWTSWFDCDLGDAKVIPPLPKAAKHRQWTKVGQYLQHLSIRLPAGSAVFGAVAVPVYHGFITLAGAEAVVFGFIVLVYVLDTGISSGISLVFFLIYFAAPFLHAMRPARRVPLILDVLFQTLFLSAAVVVMAALNLAGFIAGTGVPALDTLENDSRSASTGLAGAFRFIMDGTLFQLRGHEMFQDIFGLWMLMATVGFLRLAGQRLVQRKKQEGSNG
jgi:hypothetical protein